MSVFPRRHCREKSVSPTAPDAGSGRKEKREKKGTVWHDGSGGGKQLGQKATEALDRSKVRQKNGSILSAVA